MRKNKTYFYVFIYFRIDTLDKCFGHDTVEEIVDALVRFASSIVIENLTDSI